MQFSFAPASPAMAVLFALTGMGARSRRIELDGDHLVVRMGIGFRTSVPRSSIAGARLLEARIFAWGVHGFAGDWLVNTAGTGIVLVELSTVTRAWVLGFPIRLRKLRVSVTEPEALVAALTGAAR